MRTTFDLVGTVSIEDRYLCAGVHLVRVVLGSDPGLPASLWLLEADSFLPSQCPNMKI